MKSEIIKNDYIQSLLAHLVVISIFVFLKNPFVVKQSEPEWVELISSIKPPQIRTQSASPVREASRFAGLAGALKTASLDSLSTEGIQNVIQGEQAKKIEQSELKKMRLETSDPQLKNITKDLKSLGFKEITVEKFSAVQELKEVDLQKVRNEILRYQGYFRDCYEQRLVTDATLEGQADLLFLVGSTGNADRTDVQIYGKGTSESMSGLRECLQKVSGKLQFPKELEGIQLKFALKLKS